MKRWYGTANDHQEELDSHLGEDVKCCPSEIGSVRQLRQVLDLDAGADARQDVETEYNDKLKLLDRAISQREDDSRGKDCEAPICEGVESCLRISFARSASTDCK